MKGIIFLDKDYKPVTLPSIGECVTKTGTWENFISRVSFCFFNIPERMQWFKKTYMQCDEMNSLFLKMSDGVYSYNETDDYWYKETDISVIKKVYFAYREQEDNK